VNRQVSNRNVWTASPMAKPPSGNYGRDEPTYQPISPNLAYPGRSRKNPRAKKRNLWGLVAVFFLLLLGYLLIRAISAQGKAPVSDHGQNLVSTQSSSLLASASTAVPAGQTKILLLGSDQRPDDPGFRTDVIILLVLDPDKKTVSAISFPRDLWVKVPSLYEMKINSVFDLGGFDAMAELFQANFDVKPDYYVLTNFSGFTQIIDNQGGVDVEVGQELSDACDLPQAVNGNCTVEPGTVHMDGATALWYVRSRYTSSDFDRLRRAQEVLYALFKKMLNVSTIARLPELKAQFDGNVETNMTVNQALSFLPLATSILSSPDRIQRFSITEDQSTPFWSWDGQWILLPDYDAIHQLLLEAGVKM
jgi:LCP family protein required for cell wall assembly